MREEILNILFVCSKNKWRSPTGERVFKNVRGLSVRSAGTSKSAKRQIGAKDVRWADIILVMEEKHKSRIRAIFREELCHKIIHILDIPDEYQFMDPELVMLLNAKVCPLIGIK